MHFLLSKLCFFIYLEVFVFYSVNCKTCHTLCENYNNYLSTKTPYTYIANTDDDPLVYDDCHPVRIWAVIRHGTRNPGKVAEKMRVNLSFLKSAIITHHEEGKGSLCSQDVERLRDWEFTLDPPGLKHLTHEGEEEMLLLAERFRNRFPDLLPETYSNMTYKFRHTATQRAKESAEYFTVGLFDRRQKNQVWYPEPLAKDPVLRFYKLCKKWRVKVDKNPAAMTEVESFKKSPLVSRMLEHISQRIGLASGAVKYNDARLIYQACSFETAWHPKTPSPWCAIFSEDDFEVLEYAEDMKYYWIDGYGFPVTYTQACVAISDMFRHLTDGSYPPLTFYFSHSGTMLKLLSHLGLYRDQQPLTANSFNKSRLWRTSQIDAFGSNLAFVLFKCENSYKVLTLHQERPVTLPGCPTDDDLCPLELLQDLYAESVDNCNFNKLCDYDETKEEL